MDLQEKLNEVTKDIDSLITIQANNREKLKDLKKRQKGYLKLIEEAKSLDK